MNWVRLFSTGAIELPPCFGSLPQAETKSPPDGWQSWLAENFAHVASAPMAPRHVQVWDWFDRVRPGEPPPPPDVHIWPRGGGKSTTIQLGCAYVGDRLARRFVLYVSGTQDQANEHVASIADLLEQLGHQPLRGEQGNQKGWRKNQLRTASGFNVVGLGLDVAARGIKLGRYRPDLIILDDIDDSEDTAKATAKKIRIITRKILPTGTSHTGVLVAQNLVIPDGVAAQLYDGRADWLTDRRVHFDVAVRGLKTEPRVGEDGVTRHWIVAGEATWPGQDLAACQRQIFERGITAFRAESQHEVQRAAGYFFDVAPYLEVQEVPELSRVVRAWDYAATQGGGDFTVGVLMGKSPNGMVWVLDVVRAQLSPDNVVKLQDLATAWDRERFGSRYTVRVPQDPGSAGKRVAQEDRARGMVAVPVTGAKAARARLYAAQVNEGNARILAGSGRSPQLDAFLDEMVRGTELEGAHKAWQRAFLEEHRRFREDEAHEFDDQVDAAADAFNELHNTREFEWDF